MELVGTKTSNHHLIFLKQPSGCFFVVPNSLKIHTHYENHRGTSGSGHLKLLQRFSFLFSPIGFYIYFLKQIIMKKFIAIVILSLGLTSAQAQYRTHPDTSYCVRDGAFLRRVVQYQEVNRNEFSCQFEVAKKRKRGQRIFTAVTLGIFASLTTWYFVGVSR